MYIHSRAPSSSYFYMSAEGVTVVNQPAEVVEAQAEVDKERIEAVKEEVKDNNETAVEIAEIHAETEEKRIEAEKEVAVTAIEAATDQTIESLRRDLGECQNTIKTQADQIAALNTENQSLQAKLTALELPPPLNNQEPPASGEGVPPEAGPKEAPEQPKRKGKTHNWI